MAVVNFGRSNGGVESSNTRVAWVLRIVIAVTTVMMVITQAKSRGKM